jgi:hypothetical protein
MDMVHKTSSYYSQLSSTILMVASRKQWEKEITSAESQCLEDPLAMDIISAQEIDLPTADLALQPDRQTTALHAWLNLALSIEERQYICSGLQSQLIIFTCIHRIDVQAQVKFLQNDP